MKLYDRVFSRREIEARVGRIEQIGGVRRMRLSDGVEDGVEMIQVRTGGGLAYSVLPSHGLDISLATVGDVPITYQSPNGDYQIVDAEGQLVSSPPVVSRGPGDEGFVIHNADGTKEPIAL